MSEQFSEAPLFNQYGESEICLPKQFDDPAFNLRFWKHVDRSGECWLWKASKTAVGYGQINCDRTMKTVHRLVFALYNGSIPSGLFVLHKCDVRHCCNPDHLFLGTAADNSADMVSKNRSVRGRKNSSALRGERHSQAKLTDEEVIRLVQRYRQGGITQEEVGHEFGISGPHVCAILKGKYRKEALSALRARTSD